jgi:hypothetical protein
MLAPESDSNCAYQVLVGKDWTCIHTAEQHQSQQIHRLVLSLGRYSLACPVAIPVGSGPEDPEAVTPSNFLHKVVYRIRLVGNALFVHTGCIGKRTRLLRARVFEGDTP